ncbi:TIM23 complex component [Lecanicillium sp. MT-2017a]|nr:TIM23 complex component [Lecanicillium sp. MT-2017a]
MSASIKTLAMRSAGAARPTSTVTRCCSRSTASFSTARPACVSNRQLTVSVPKTFSRASHGLSIAPKKASSATPTPTTTGRRSIAPEARFFSSASAQLNTAADASTAAGKCAAHSSAALDWNSFFQLRVKRRRIQLVFSVTTGLLGGAGGAILLSTGMAEPLVMQVPLDPFVTLGLMTMACAGMGWLVGPSMGNQVFYLMNRRYKSQMMEKESEFFARVKKNRVDPSNSSAGNPVPDFYGEKIQSVAGYRRWLKDQRAFNRKKTAAFV